MKPDKKEYKLILIGSSQKEKLVGIQSEIRKFGVDISLNQLIRDSIDVLVNLYWDVIIKKYTPLRFKEISKND